MEKKYTSQTFYFYLFFLLFSVSNAQVGIGTTDPTTQLDVDGAISLREGGVLTLVNGNNNNVNLGATPYSFYRITGPSAAFTIRTIIPATNADGQVVILENTTTQTMTIRHNNGGSTSRRVFCPGGRNLVMVSQYATVTLMYNASQSRWIVTDYADLRYGDNIQSVTGTSNITTNSSTYSDMTNMTITFTPNHSTVYVSFTASGHMDISGSLPAAAYAQFRLVNGAASTTYAGVSTLATDYDFDDIFGEIVAVSWNGSIAMFPVNVTPGVSTTLKIQWLRDGIFPTTLLNSVATFPEFSHRVLTIFD